MHVYERHIGKVERMFKLPENVEDEKIEADEERRALGAHPQAARARKEQLRNAPLRSRITTADSRQARDRLQSVLQKSPRAGRPRRGAPRGQRHPPTPAATDARARDFSDARNREKIVFVSPGPGSASDERQGSEGETEAHLCFE